MKKIGVMLQSDFGTVSQKTGLETLTKVRKGEPEGRGHVIPFLNKNNCLGLVWMSIFWFVFGYEVTF